MSTSSPSSPGATASASPSGLAAPSRGRVPCQYPGCLTRAKYGPKEGPPTACQAHKRTGQFTINRHGEMLVATRDGDAFRAPAAAAPVSRATSSAPTETPDRSRRLSLGGSEKSASSSGKKAAKTSASKAAKTSTRPTEGAKRANKPGLASRKADGSPPSQSQSRPCLFPGNEGIDEVSLSKVSSAAAATPGSNKKARALTTKDEGGAKKARHGAKSTGKDGPTGSNGDNQADEMSIEKYSKESPTADASRLKATVGTTATSPRKSVSAGPPASRMGDVEGMAPSAEILLVRQAREAAKREAEAGGGGRRPRAPSRRALEASGRMTGTGAQWMTREKKAEEARMNAELREQRKQYRAAGLKVGVVLEAFVPGAAAAGAVGSGSVGGVGVGVGGGSAEAGKEALMPQVDPGWHKVPPAALSAPPPQPQTADDLEAPSPAAVEMGEKQDTPTAAANSA